ncbi:hypothetical protein HDU76_008915 [Blyttiomyces sp. JEL0837]|nr:hypothetical protein HDU76_008915 [Blyttiomyces sp. JEL0837]
MAMFAIQYNYVELLKYLVDDIKVSNLVDLLGYSANGDINFQNESNPIFSLMINRHKVDPITSRQRFWSVVTRDAIDKRPDTVDLYFYLREKGALNEDFGSTFCWTPQRIQNLLVNRWNPCKDVLGHCRSGYCDDVSLVKAIYKVCKGRDVMLSEEFDFTKIAKYIIDFIKYLHQIGSRAFNINTIDHAAGFGIWRQNAISGAMAGGHLETVKYLQRKFGMVATIDAVILAAGKGFFDIVKYVKVLFTPEVMDAAARCGSLRLVRYLHQNGKGGCTNQALFNCIRMCSCLGARKDVLKFLLEDYLAVFDIVEVYSRLDKCESWAKAHFKNNRGLLLGSAH